MLRSSPILVHLSTQHTFAEHLLHARHWVRLRNRKLKSTETLPLRSSESKDKREMQETVKHREEMVDILAFRHASYYSNCYPNLPTASYWPASAQVKKLRLYSLGNFTGVWSYHDIQAQDSLSSNSLILYVTKCQIMTGIIFLISP